MRDLKFRAWTKDEMIYEGWNKDFFVTKEIIFRFDNVMQYTGLKDKNGKEIYEGDFDKKFGVVRWMQESCEYVFENEEGFVCLTKNFCESESEIIGNIYEHPHLLNSDKEDKRSVARDDDSSNKAD